jgi:leucyl-tRNA synthetase
MSLHRELTRGAEEGADPRAMSEAREIYLRLLAPVAPHIAEELWERLGMSGSVHTQAWPEANAELAAEDMVTVAVQVNGKLRSRITIAADASEDDVKSAALADANVSRYVQVSTITKVVFVPNRLISFVVR